MEDRVHTIASRVALSKRNVMRRLKPTSRISVFHGNGSRAEIYKFCKTGIDAKQPKGRLYPHWSGGKKLEVGLFVSPSLAGAEKFSGTHGAVVKFKTLGKNLWHMFPEEQGRDDKVWKSKHPKSFRPSVTEDMFLNVEPQALFRGFVSPRQIEKVYVIDGSKVIGMSRKEFMELVESSEDQYVKKVLQRDVPNHVLFEPQEVHKATYRELVKRLVEGEGLSRRQVEKGIEMSLRRFRDDEDLLHEIRNLMGHDSVPYSVAKKLLPELKKRFELGG